MRPNERLGAWVGEALAPLAAVVSHARRARTFHPEGKVVRAEVEVDTDDLVLARVGERLAGPALLRFSTALWRGGREWLDVLGLALRLRSTDEVSAEPAPGDQDILFATVRSPWTTLVAPLRTAPHDFLANDYYAVSPFAVPELGKVKWRIVSPRWAGHGEGREERLLEAIASHASLSWQVRRLGLGMPWRRVARVTLLEAVTVDEAELRFWPFRVGRHIEPRGFVHAIRRAVYEASQRARPAHSSES